MGHLQILANPLKVGGLIQVIHLIGGNDPMLYREMEEDIVEQIALLFLKWNYREIIIDPTMIIY